MIVFPSITYAAVKEGVARRHGEDWIPKEKKHIGTQVRVEPLVKL